MKTAMQFLKDEIKSKIIPSSKENGELTDYQYGHNIAYSVVLTLAEYLLEKEKEQIIDSYYGKIDGVFGYREEGEQYYNQTYNQEETLEEWKSKFTHHCAVKDNTKQHIIDIMKADEDDGLYKTFDIDPDKKH
jgi:hypothetical protein